MNKAKLLSTILLAGISLFVSGQTNIPESPAWDVYPDTWVATDGAGRVMPGNADVGDYKYGKQHTVGIFYVTWHTSNLYNMHSPYGADVSKVLENDPNARKDKNNAAWQPQYYNSYHWGEPEMGYFLSADPFVIRRDVSMLADAGVDVLILDVTNAVRYWDEWEALCKVLTDMKAEGNKVPQICFWSFNGEAIYVVQEIYDLFYSKGKYKDLWFYWYGKPLLLYNATPINDANGAGHKLRNYLYNPNAATNPNNPHYGDPLYTSEYLTDYPDYIKDFFTLRNMWWGYAKWYGSKYVGTEDNWAFGYEMHTLGSYRAEDLVSRHKGKYEEYAVTPAQHPSSMVGKCWTRKGGEPQLDEYDMPVPQYVESAGRVVDDPESYGIYFQERWDEALSVNPDFIYLNDWNEYTAGKYAGDNITFMRRSNNGFHFIDQYNAEFNRTIGPVKGRYTDNYYMQMAANIRKYKGVRNIPQNFGIAAQDVSKPDPSAWEKIKTEYRDTKGDITHRSYGGYGGLRYTDELGRNDIVLSKIAVTTDSIYFYVESKDNLTPCENDNWMLLFIDSDNNHSTGWNGYDYVVNKTIENGKVSSIMSCGGDVSTWKKTADAHLNVNGNKLVVAVSRKDLKLTGDNITFDFKWVDNPRDFDSPIGLATAGDAAPNRRFNYRFIWHRYGSEQVSAKEKLIELIDKCSSSKLTESHSYGKNPGMVADSAVVARYEEAFKNAYSQASLELDDSYYENAAEELNDAAQALKNAPTVPLADGYYFITSANPAYTNTTIAIDQSSVNAKVMHWREINEDRANFVWKITADKGGYVIQNYFSLLYVNKSTLNNSSSTIRLTDTIGAKQLITPLNHAGQFTITNEVYPVPYYQKNGENGIATSGYVSSKEGGANSCAAWKFVNADGYFIRNLKNPLDSVARLAKEKVLSSVVIRDGSPDPLSPAYNTALKPLIDRLAALLAKDTVLDIHSITKADIDTLAQAYDNLLAIWPDTAELSLVCRQTESFLNNSTCGDEVGEASDEAYSALQKQYEATLAKRPFYAFLRRDIDSLTSALREKLSYASTAVNYPAEDIWYHITSQDTTAASSVNPYGECIYASGGNISASVYREGKPEENNHKVRAAWRFVSLGKGTYAIQNAGSGWYLGTCAKEGETLKMSESPVAYKLELIGNRQWALRNLENGLRVANISKRRNISLKADSAQLNMPASWYVSRVTTNDLRDSLNFVEGSLSVLTLPYYQTALPQTVNGEEMKFYVVSGSKLDATGKTIAIDMTEYGETTVPAGYPLICIIGNEYKVTSYIPFHTFPETDGEVVTRGMTVNGLVGMLKTTTIQNDTCGYFSIRSVVPMTSKRIIQAQSGYLNATSVANLDNVPTDLTANVSGNGLTNSISEITGMWDETVDVFSVEGVRVRQGIKMSQALKHLAPGIYIIGNRKFVVK